MDEESLRNGAHLFEFSISFFHF